MGVSKLLCGICLLASAGPGGLGAAELEVGTLKAWEEYVRDADSRVQAQANSTRRFLWMDESQGRRAQVRRGDIIVAPVVGHGIKSVQNGLIHDWIGAVFIPNATIESLNRVLHDYDRYKNIYKPVVTDSRTLRCKDASQQFEMTWQRKVLFVNAAVQGQYLSRDITLDTRRGYNIADTTTVQEIENFGRANAKLLPPDTGRGFIWRLHSIGRYEEADGGVYLELEVMALTRNIPASLGWLVNPVVNHLSQNSLATTLRQTREAVTQVSGYPESLAKCQPRGRQREGTSSIGE